MMNLFVSIGSRAFKSTCKLILLKACSPTPHLLVTYFDTTLLTFVLNLSI